MSNGLDVALVKDPNGKWPPDHRLQLLNIDFSYPEWESFFFEGLGAAQARPFDDEPWGDFFDRRPFEFRESLTEYPLLARIDDFYQDAYFAESEIPFLEDELLRASDLKLNEDAKSFLAGMLAACKAAASEKMAIRLLSS
jgi:hypothetical protein